jgi:hypothetical protein
MNLVGSEKVKGRSEKKMVGKCKAMATNKKWTWGVGLKIQILQG